MGISVVDTLALLTPWDIDIEKIRLGRNADGGYVVVNDLDPRQHVVSIGIGGDVSFDRAMSDRGHRVFMFDHTVAGPPSDVPHGRFWKEGVAGQSKPAESLYSLADLLERHEIDGTDLFLKIDVEGHEWEVFLQTPNEVLSRFRQIAVEVHRIERVVDRDFRERVFGALSKINKQFTLCHVHANNGSKLTNAKGYMVAEVLELSYIRSSLVNRRPSQTLYPSPLDWPNMRGKPDYNLWFFPFLPTPLPKESFSMSEDRQRLLVREAGLEDELAGKKKK